MQPAGNELKDKVMSKIKTIIADWGTSNLRAFALDAGGNAIAKQTKSLGLLKVKDRNFAGAFDEVFSIWRENTQIPVLLSGMIGSKLGWVEVPYVECPATLQSIAKSIAPVEERENVWIVPGVCLPPKGDRHDVIRGEEVQVFGALDIFAVENATVCLPGTHSKWLRAENASITTFSTAMSGEIFDVMKNHSILGQLINENGDSHDAEAFSAGLLRASEPGGILHHLFSVRSEGLFDVIDGSGLGSYLSGIIIGREIIDLSQIYPTGNDAVLLIGSTVLSKLYAKAFDHFKIKYSIVDGDQAAIRGLQLVLESSGNK